MERIKLHDIFQLKKWGLCVYHLSVVDKLAIVGMSFWQLHVGLILVVVAVVERWLDLTIVERLK